MDEFYNIPVIIDDKNDLDNIYISLKSDVISIFNSDEIEDIIRDNGIVFKNNEEWIGTRKSFICLCCEDRENMMIIKSLLEKYKMLVLHTYKKNTNYILFAINKYLLSSYHDSIKKFMLDNYEIDDVNIYLSISNQYSKSEIKNTLNENDIKYLFINDCISSDLEIIIPEDLSHIIFKLKNKDRLTEEEINKKETWKKSFLDITQNMNLYLIDLDSPIDYEELMELLE